ncbi:cysteinyl leukotriene receptor 1-like [Gigantopelta aegis]|uniref:cysteinyl leukotriene receptor 1-like n=1 Tax=Gigantopelta aegis TaxID=1735272 RepID=UPI001B88DC0C|nr:cysteinyl leukotriene receptor 1-like [Gigantopelta aegis]
MTLNDTDATTDANTLSNATGPGSPTAIYSNLDTAFWICIVTTVVIGLVGNAFIFPLMRDVKFSSLSYPVYLIFLAVSDSTVLIMYCIYQTLRFFDSFHIIGKNVAACRLWLFLMSTVTLLSPWLVVGLTVDRFFCVVFPMKRDRFCTPRKAKIVCSCLTALSVLLMLPLLEGVKVIEKSNICFIKDHLLVYFAFFRISINSNLPCLLIIVFNVVIGIHIQRSTNFRKRFTSTSSGSTENKLDKSLLPLMLISLMALVTFLPSSLADSIVTILVITKSYPNTLKQVAKFSPSFIVLYLINFGQNFYILMASSANYRKIMKKKLKCQRIFGEKKNVTELRVSGQVSDTKANTTELSTRESLYSGSTSVISPATDFSEGSTK